MDTYQETKKKLARGGSSSAAPRADVEAKAKPKPKAKSKGKEKGRGADAEGETPAQPRFWARRGPKKQPLLPAARASKYVGQQFGHALLRHLVCSCSGLGRFARSLFGRFDLHTGHTEAATDSLPMPLPYPEVLRGGNHGESIELARKKLINCIVIVLNHLH